jgi:hypothetical protein
MGVPAQVASPMKVAIRLDGDGSTAGCVGVCPLATGADAHASAARITRFVRFMVVFSVHRGSDQPYCPPRIPGGPQRQADFEWQSSPFSLTWRALGVPALASFSFNNL